MELNDEIKTLKGVGDKVAENFYKLNIYNIDDLIRHYPRDFDIYEPITSAKEIISSEKYAILAIVAKVSRPVRIRNLTILNVQVISDGIPVKITFFNMPYIGKSLKVGTNHVFRGKILLKKGTLVMEQPQVLKEEEYQPKIGILQPIYRVTNGISNHTIQKAVLQVKNCIEKIEDYLPAEILTQYHLPNLKDAYYQMHFPDSKQNYENARKRLVFDEFLTFLIQTRKMNLISHTMKSDYSMIETAETQHVLEALPYQLTGAQTKVWNEIKTDLQSGKVMNRMIQGDVGSGKTILAFLAMIMTASNGYQTVLMAPTEVLAKQHFEQFERLLKQHGFSFHACLLTGSMKAKEKKEIQNAIQEGIYQIIIGTHAVFQEKAEYKNLALVITDEQHRFGVKQRETLVKKGSTTNVIVMSATPIPRSLAMILYSNMNMSILDEMPKGRKPIKNCVVNEQYRDKINSFIIGEVAKKHQVYIICPMIDENELLDIENVTEYYEKLKSVLPEQIQLGLLHGKMKNEEKNRIMDQFAYHQIDVLVSTTVIEVGINVPNATLMIIENAERFGLASLHQLRGRVGRSDEQSYCIFVNGNESKEKNERLEILLKSNDGFEIANEDLKLRGPGDITGIAQSGVIPFEIGDIYHDADMLKTADCVAEKILAEDENLSSEKYAPFYRYIVKQNHNEIDFRTI